MCNVLRMELPLSSTASPQAMEEKFLNKINSLENEITSLKDELGASFEPVLTLLVRLALFLQPTPASPTRTCVPRKIRPLPKRIWSWRK